MHAHNVFKVRELCRTRAEILKPTLDRTLVASQITEIYRIYSNKRPTSN